MTGLELEACLAGRSNYWSYVLHCSRPTREHIQPLLKYYTLSQGEQIHIAGWPPLDPFVEGSPGFYSMSAEGGLSNSPATALDSRGADYELNRLPDSIANVCR